MLLVVCEIHNSNEHTYKSAASRICFLIENWIDDPLVASRIYNHILIPGRISQLRYSIVQGIHNKICTSGSQSVNFNKESELHNLVEESQDRIIYIPAVSYTHLTLPTN